MFLFSVEPRVRLSLLRPRARLYNDWGFDKIDGKIKHLEQGG